MKKIINIIAAFVAILCLASCGEQNIIVPEVSVTPASVAVEGLKSVGTVAVTSNTSWTITTDAEWLTFFPVGAGGATKDMSVNVIAATNEGAARTAVVTITAGGIATTTFTVQQAATPVAYISVDNEDLSMYAVGQSRGLRITSNFDWVAESDADWLTISPAKGVGDDETIVAVTATQNFAQQAREGNITITAKGYSGDAVKVLNVKQIAANQPLVEFNVSDTLKIAAEGVGEKEIKISGNFDWTAATDADWIALSPASGTAGAEVKAILAIPANVALNPRTGVINFTCNNAKFPLTIVQAATPVVLNVSTPVSLPKAGGATNFVVESNYPWTAETEAGWLKIEPASGTAGSFNQITLSADANAGLNRTATIIIKAGDQIKTVSLAQAGEDPVLSIDPVSAKVSAAGGIVTVNVTTNMTVAAKPSADWISVSNAGNVYTVTVGANPFAAKRTGYVSFTGAEADILASLSIEEAGNDASILLSEDFSWLNYGSTDPWNTTDETRMDLWTEAEKAHGWTSTLVNDGKSTTPLVYARPGFVKLGKTSWAGDLISPKLTGISGTQDIVVTFDAIGYSSAGGTLDDGVLTVSVLGPGTISQSTFTIDNYPDPKGTQPAGYDPWASSLATRTFTVSGASSETQIRFLGGASFSLSGVGAGKNRIFLDNIVVKLANAEEPMSGLDEPVKWNFNVNDTVSASVAKYVVDNALPSRSGTGYLSFYFLPDNTTLDQANAKKEARVIGGTGQPYNTGVWPGDYWEFSVPVKHFKSGTVVRFTGILRASGTGMKYWLMQYKDGGEWKTAGTAKTETVTYNASSTSVTYTHALNNTDNLNIDQTMTFTSAIPDGNVQVRFTCAANWQASGKGPLTAPNGGTVRWQGNDNPAPAEGEALVEGPILQLGQ